MYKLLVLLSFIQACGQSHNDSTPAAAESAPVKSSNIGATLYDSSAEVPDCGADNFHELIYVVEVKEFQYCDASKTWVVIDVTGKAGQNGKDGAAGAAGAPGAPGMKIAEMYACNASSDLNTDPNVTVNEYSVVVTKFTDASYLISCESGIINNTIGYADSAYQSLFFAPDSMGVAHDAITCFSYYATASYKISTNTVTYNMNGDAQTEDVVCSSIYAH